MSNGTDTNQIKQAPTRKARKSSGALIDAELVVDTREQRSFDFTACTSKHVNFKIVREGLSSGDYSARLLDEFDCCYIATIERKSHADLLGTLTHHRERFIDELERLRPFGFKAVIIEASLSDIVMYRGLSGQVNPTSIIASLIAWQQRYGVHVVYASNRKYAEVYTWRLLERWVRDRAAIRREVGNAR